jgi:hypothetical protein
MNGMNGHSNGDAAWHREMRERKNIENAAYRKGQEDMRLRTARECAQDNRSAAMANIIMSMEIKDYGRD